ncbi:MAG: hypothetical protein JSW00_06300 [Thermoplasmata archaeon]|jgi:hypothetical protein|nr:MAG: hypothetical protein JSW00_06300 [Thermoplasmata archaeon]
MSPSIQEVKEKHAARLLATEGVVSVGIGQDPDGKSVIIIGLDAPRPQTQKKLPKELDSYPVRVEIIGPVKAQ